MSKYSKMWEAARMPTLDDLRQGKRIAVKWKVRLNIWPWWDDRKVVLQSAGYNIDSRGEWGFWRMSWDSIKRYMVLNYDHPNNSKFARRIVDHIRILPDGTIIGRFYLRVFGRLWFLSWFTMERSES